MVRISRVRHFAFLCLHNAGVVHPYRSRLAIQFEEQRAKTFILVLGMARQAKRDDACPKINRWHAGCGNAARILSVEVHW